MIAILALIGEAFLESGSQTFAPPALGLGKSVSGLAQFMGMGNLLARRQRQEIMEAGVYAYVVSTSRGDGLGLRVNEEAEIPPRRALDDASTFEASCWNVLRMKAHVADAWNMDACVMGRFERIGERKTGEFVPLAFEPGFIGQFLIATLPGRIRGIEHALQRMARDAELFAVVSQQIMEVFLGIKDTVFGVLLDLADGPIPHASQLEQPGSKLDFLPGGEA